MATKAVRFSEKEEKLISKFLELNPMFDFSSLTRTAIMNFIENPKIELKAININEQQDNTHNEAQLH